MLVRAKRVVCSCAAALLASAAHAAGNGITFQGEGFIEGVNEACTQNGITTGDFYRVVYRYKNAASDQNDAASFITTIAVFRIYSAATSGSLNGQTATLNTIITGYATLGDEIAGSSNLTIASNGGNATPDAINLKMVGTIDNFLNFTGCTVTFHGNLVRRPD